MCVSLVFKEKTRIPHHIVSHGQRKYPFLGGLRWELDTIKLCSVFSELLEETGFCL